MSDAWGAISMAAPLFASSGKLHSRVSMTGRPAAAASRIATLKPSLKDGSTKRVRSGQDLPLVLSIHGPKKNDAFL